MDQKRMKLCTTHNLEIVLVDLEVNIAQGSRFLCIRCIVEKMNLKKIKLFDETKHMIQEMNNNEINRKIEYNNKRLMIFNKIESQLRELKQNIDSVFDQIFNNIHSKLSQIQNDRANIQQESIILNFEEDIERLSQFQECQISEQVIHFMESDQKFIEQIQMLLQHFINSDYCNKVMSDSFIFIDQNTVLNVQQHQKTPTLKLICEEHKKEIIMVNLNMKANSQPKKMACIKCIQQYPVQYTPLEDANILWSQYQMRNEANLNEIQKSRILFSSKILQVIQEFKLQHDQICDELISALRNQQQSIEELNQKKINVQSIYRLTSNQIDAVIDQLSQIDKQESSKDHKTNIEKIDKIFYSDLYSRLEHQIQQSQINLQKFNSIVNNNNNSLIIEVENLFQLNQQKDKFNNKESADIIYICEKIRLLMDKIFTFESSQPLFLEIINQNLKIKEEIGDLQLILTNKLQKSEEFNQIFQEFNKYSEKFKQNYIRFQYFLDIDKTSNQLTEMKEKEIQHQKYIELQDYKMIKEIEQSIRSTYEENKKLQEQIEFIHKEKQEQNNRFDSQQQKQKEILEQKITLEKLNKEKDESIRQLNETIESIDKQNQYLALKLNNPVYLKLCQIVSSQYQKQLIFSQINKHINCQVSSNGKQVENGAYCLCDQVIPKNGVTLFAFKIISLTAHCYIGIGIKEIIENNNYYGNIGLGYGSYTINQYTYCFSHHDKAREAKVLSFEFSINDIILVEVDIQNKTIKWTKANTNQSFTLNIDTTYDLYPCLWVRQSGGIGNKVQILESLE